MAGQLGRRRRRWARLRAAVCLLFRVRLLASGTGAPNPTLGRLRVQGSGAAAAAGWQRSRPGLHTIRPLRLQRAGGLLAATRWVAVASPHHHTVTATWKAFEQ